MSPRLAIEGELEKRLFGYLSMALEGMELLPKGGDESKVEMGELDGPVAGESEECV